MSKKPPSKNSTTETTVQNTHQTRQLPTEQALKSDRFKRPRAVCSDRNPCPQLEPSDKLLAEKVAIAIASSIVCHDRNP